MEARFLLSVGELTVALTRCPDDFLNAVIGAAIMVLAALTGLQIALEQITLVGRFALSQSGIQLCHILRLMEFAQNAADFFCLVTCCGQSQIHGDAAEVVLDFLRHGAELLQLIQILNSSRILLQPSLEVGESTKRKL